MMCALTMDHGTIRACVLVLLYYFIMCYMWRVKFILLLRACALTLLPISTHFSKRIQWMRE